MHVVYVPLVKHVVMMGWFWQIARVAALMHSVKLGLLAQQRKSSLFGPPKCEKGTP